MDRKLLTRFAWLSIIAAIITIGLKSLAFHLTGSVGLLSDAIESIVNLAAAILALIILTIAARPPDEEHLFGHNKAEYFASGAEGVLIVLAAISIGITAVKHLIDPQPLEMAGIGLLVSAFASLINFSVARLLLNIGKKYNSITLEADAKHLMTDVWTSSGVILGVGAVAITGLTWFDPIIALAVALNIVRSGFNLMRKSIHGLMDITLPAHELEIITTILDTYKEQGIQFHALRTRQAAGRRFVSFHVLVPGEWTVNQGHNLLEQIERNICQKMDNTTIITHLEPIDDDLSFQDIDLDRL